MAKRKRTPRRTAFREQIRPKFTGDLRALAKELGMQPDSDGKTFVPKIPAVQAPPSPQAAINRKHADLIGELAERVKDLENKVSTLQFQLMEQGQKTVDPDDLGFRILKFLKDYAPLKFNTGSIAGNLEVGSVHLSDKLRTMATRGTIQSEKREGHSTMWWYEQATADTQELTDGD